MATITFDIEPFDDGEELNPAEITEFVRQLNDLLSHGADFPFRIGPAELLETGPLPDLTMNTLEGELNLLILQGSWQAEDPDIAISRYDASAVIRGGDGQTLYRVILTREPLCDVCGGPLGVSSQHPHISHGDH